MQIAARKGDLTIGDDTGTSTLSQGQQTTREESQSQDDSQSQNSNKNNKKKKGAAAPAAAPAAGGGVLDSPCGNRNWRGRYSRCDSMGVAPEQYAGESIEVG